MLKHLLFLSKYLLILICIGLLEAEGGCGGGEGECTLVAPAVAAVLAYRCLEEPPVRMRCCKKVYHLSGYLFIHQSICLIIYVCTVAFQCEHYNR